MMITRRSNSVHVSRRGLSIIELMLSLTITVIVAGAIASMMAAVGTGVGSRRDVRTTMIHASATQTRLNAYIAPSRCVLAMSRGEIVLWMNDERPSATVHATEIRWLKYDEAAESLNVHFVQFPESWSEAAKDLADRQFAVTTDWQTVFQLYENNGHLSTFQLDEGIASMTVTKDKAAALDSRHLVFDINYADLERTIPVTVASTIRFHDPPVR